MTDPALAVLLWFILPLWFVAGFADWLCHRATKIETTAGAKESLIHLLMFAEIGVPLLAALFFEINALIIALMIVAVLAHEATALWDVSYPSLGAR
jgi:Ca2+/Na+ antiporter